MANRSLGNISKSIKNFITFAAISGGFKREIPRGPAIPKKIFEQVIP
jgi:hypothetical protein